MEFEVLIHLEPVPEEQRFVWWAESDELPGFTASASHLPELLEKAAAVVHELAGEDATIRTRLVETDAGSAPAGDPATLPERSEGSSEASAIQRVLVST